MTDVIYSPYKGGIYMEHWKPIVGMENFYEISNIGNIRSLKRTGITKYGKREYGGKLIKPFIASSGYPSVNLTKSGYRKQYTVHSLMLEAFVCKRPKNMEGCHNDGNKENWKLKNLRWDTRKNNHNDQKIHGTKPKTGKKITEDIANQIKNLDAKIIEIAKKYDLSATQIWRIKTNRAWNV